MKFEIVVSTGKQGNHLPSKASRWVVEHNNSTVYAVVTLDVPACLRQLKLEADEEVKQVVVTRSYAE